MNKEKKIKYIIDNNSSEYGNKNFPHSLNSIECFCLGTFGDFEKPYYHRVLCCEYVDYDGMHHYEIIGKYSHKISLRKFLFFGKPIKIILFGFRSSFLKEDVDKLLF